MKIKLAWSIWGDLNHHVQRLGFLDFCHPLPNESGHCALLAWILEAVNLPLIFAKLRIPILYGIWQKNWEYRLT